MPELPEVDFCRYQLASACVGREVAEVRCREEGGGPRQGLFDDLVISPEGTTEEAFVSAHLGTRLVEVSRKGKYIFMVFAAAGLKRRVSVWHLGMTGSFVVRGMPVPSYKAFTVSDTWPPKFTKVRFVFKDARAASPVEFAFCDPRRLGRIRLLQGTDPLAEPPMSKLAPDLLLDASSPGLSHESFTACLGAVSAPVKAVLLDQERLCSGAGNYIADEALYRARIHPSSPASALPPAAISALRQALFGVVAEGAGALQAGKDLPGDWLFHVRWGKGKGKQRASIGGETVRFDTVGGRTSAYVDSQVLYSAAKAVRASKTKTAVTTATAAAILGGSEVDDAEVKTTGKESGLKRKKTEVVKTEREERAEVPDKPRARRHRSK